MRDDVQQPGEVVVTAPSIRITQTQGGSAGAVSINVRGLTSITGNNQPIIILDGMPIRNGGTGKGRQTAFARTREKDRHTDKRRPVRKKRENRQASFDTLTKRQNGKEVSPGLTFQTHLKTEAGFCRDVPWCVLLTHNYL